MLMKLQKLCKTCASLIGRSVILFYFMLSQIGKILAQFLCNKSFILFYSIVNGQTAIIFH